MNTKTLVVITVGIFMVALPAAAEGTGEAPVAVKTDNLPTHVRARLEAAAQQGSQAVIRFVNRTRMLYMLRAEDVIGK